MVGDAHCLSRTHVRFGSKQTFAEAATDVRYGFEIDHQLELCWLYDWQVGRFFALDDAASIGASLPIRTLEARAIRDQAADIRVVPMVVNRRNPLMLR
jgi:hypothetical protein